MTMQLWCIGWRIRMDMYKIFEKANSEMASTLVSSYQDYEHKVAELTEQIDAYKTRAADLENELINEIIYDLFVSMELALTGMYRHSFISTRCALELGVALFKFRDDNMSFLLWKKNVEDISWSSFFDENRGVFSIKYANLFAEKFDYTHVQSRAAILYRECSEYVHGKYGYITLLGDPKISYNKALCQEALDICVESIKILNTLILIRFGNKSDRYFELYESLRKEFELY